MFDVVPGRTVDVCIDEGRFADDGFWNIIEELLVLFEGDIETLDNVRELTVLIEDENGV